MGSILALAKSQYEIARDILEQIRKSHELAKEFEEMDPDLKKDIEHDQGLVNKCEKKLNTITKDVDINEEIINKLEKNPNAFAGVEIPKDFDQNLSDPLLDQLSVKIPKHYMVSYDSLMSMSEEELMLTRMKFQIWNSDCIKHAVVFPDIVDQDKINNVVDRLRKENIPKIKTIVHKDHKLLIKIHEDWEEKCDKNLVNITNFIEDFYYNRLAFMRKSSDFKAKYVANVFQKDLQDLHSYLTLLGYNPVIENYRIVLYCNW